jgi:transcriptional regulator with XRE-family HTH domain
MLATVEDASAEVRKTLGEFIRLQRGLAQLSLRQLSEVSEVSNAYLSQVERGLYMPSAQVLKSVAKALDLSAETLYAQAGLLDEQEGDPPTDVEHAIRLDQELTVEQKEALMAVYRGFREHG